jgi:pre-mRNA-processing factor 8
LGGVETILEHTLFKATAFPSWEGLFWERACLAKGTRLLRYDGSEVNVEDVKEGDQLLGPDGEPRTAFNIVSGEDRLYRIKIGESKEDLVVTPNHILVLHREKSSGGADGEESSYDNIEMFAEEFAALSPEERSRYRSPGFESPEFSEAQKKRTEHFNPQMHRFEIKDISLESHATQWAGFRVDKDQLYLRHDHLVLHNSGFEEVSTLSLMHS